MDFEKILRVARNNELTKKEPIKCLQTKFKPPTKEQHEREKTLSEGVQRFLARKEEEEKKRQKDAERKKLELMALRAKDPKANKRIQTMLKRTKSANKSVMEDAIDNENTADTLAGPSQPDEDDYGFVSESSSQLYNKLIQKMYSTPSNDTPKFAPSKKPSSCNLSNTKERVKMALLKQEEEERLPHKRKRKGKDKGDGDDDLEDNISVSYSAPDRDISKNSSDPIKEKPKVKKPMPPPVNFQELLKIAEQKQHEPIVFEPKIKKPQEPEVLMTKKQRLEHEKLQEIKRQRELRLQNLENGSKSVPENKKSMSKINKSSSSDQKPSLSSEQKKSNECSDKGSYNKLHLKSQDKNDKNSISSKSKEAAERFQKSRLGMDKKVSSQSSMDKLIKDVDEETSRLKRERDEALRMLKEKEKLIRERDEAFRKLKEKEQLIKERDEIFRKFKLLEESEKNKSAAKSETKTVSGYDRSGVTTKKLSSDKSLTKNPDIAKSSTSKTEINNSKSGPITKNNVPKSVTKSTGKSLSGSSGVREFPPKDLKPPVKMGGTVAARNGQTSKKFPPADVRRRALALKRRRIESDDEYDSELDDFIDDGDNNMGSEEVSKVISEIFRYDKNKYSRYDDLDDECMESNFAQISKEEFFSTKCGILEDLQDIQREKAMMARAKRNKR